jgi:hypothetical protein
LPTGDEVVAELAVPPLHRQVEIAAANQLAGMTLRWRELDSNLYGAFSCQVVVFGLLPVLCSEREAPFFIPSPAIRFAERAEGVKGPKR